MLFMAANAGQSDGSLGLRVNSPGILFKTDADRKALRAMRAAEEVYHKQLGIYKPSLAQRLQKLFKTI